MRSRKCGSSPTGSRPSNGRNAGGTINIITKGGTNQLHASGWYNARRDRWNANDFLRNAQGLPKPVYHVNISGYSVGGPIVIPKLMDGGNRKLFFFASQEFTKDARPITPVIANLPTAAERAGDFSETRQTNGSLLVIRDPQTGQPFPGNRIPQERINPTGRAILGLLPAPNGYTDPRPGQQFTANFQSQNSPEHFRRDDVIRVDANLTDRTSMYVKYIRDRRGHDQLRRRGAGCREPSELRARLDHDRSRHAGAQRFDGERDYGRIRTQQLRQPPS